MRWEGEIYPFPYFLVTLSNFFSATLFIVCQKMVVLPYKGR